MTSGIVIRFSSNFFDTQVLFIITMRTVDLLVNWVQSTAEIEQATVTLGAMKPLGLP